MIALSTQDITLEFGGEVILSEVSFAINDGDRLGIIGVNGAGKSSLFKIITGEYAPTSGAVYVQKGHTVGMLSQNADLTALPRDTSCLEYMYTAHPELIALEGEISATEEALAEAAKSGEEALTMSLTAKLAEQTASRKHAPLSQDKGAFLIYRLCR